jgi:hypothetical protein
VFVPHTGATETGRIMTMTREGSLKILSLHLTKKGHNFNWYGTILISNNPQNSI